MNEKPPAEFDTRPPSPRRHSRVPAGPFRGSRPLRRAVHCKTARGLRNDAGQSNPGAGPPAKEITS
ncbi:hypothetical protein ABEB36_001985 [Hypothenemus hampei]|uniref:Uncharacterized protein n=1 Tax=Hypothenemus hampei TaxID=57062 RepID=A0ABD1FIA0_HYPHA